VQKLTETLPNDPAETCTTKRRVVGKEWATLSVNLILASDFFQLTL